MPAYEYNCKACSTTATIVKKLDDPAVPACEKCGQPMIKNFNVGAVYIR